MLTFNNSRANLKQVLTGKVAVITGSAGGIGRSTALALARQGVSVAVADLLDDAGHATAREVAALGVEALYVRCDVTSDSDVAALHERVMARFGRVDILMNNAGVLAGGGFADIPIEAWRRCLDVNLLGAVRCTRAFLPQLRACGSVGRAHIVNTASLSGLFANEPCLTPYAASKAALISLSETLAVSLKGSGIAVTCLCPGAVMTDMGSKVTLYGEERALGVFALRYVPIKTPEEVASSVIDAILSDRFLVTSSDRLGKVMADRAGDPDAFVARMAAFQATGEEFPI